MKRNGSNRKGFWRKNASGRSGLPQRAKLTRAELKEKAKTDPEAAAKWAALKAREAEARQRKKEREEARMGRRPRNMPAMMAERKAEYERTRTAKRKAEHDALVERAKTDPEAARQLTEHRKYQSEAAVRSYQKMKGSRRGWGTRRPSNDTKPTWPSAGRTTTKRKKSRRRFQHEARTKNP